MKVNGAAVVNNIQVYRWLCAIITWGFRHMASDTLEFAAGFSRIDIFDHTSNQTAFGLRVYSSEKMSLGAGYSTGDDVDVLLFDIRVGC